MRLSILTFLLFSFCSLQAQMHYGFKGGLGITNIDGETEMGEAYDTDFGFHISLEFMYNITDDFMVGAGFGYMQKGASYTYEGDSYLPFRRVSDNEVVYFDGLRNMSTTLSTDHLDIPFYAAYKPIKWVEFKAGFYLSMTVGAKEEGGLQFSPDGNEPIELDVQKNYVSDNAGVPDNEELETAIINGSQYYRPSAISAYYEYPEVDKNLFKFLDYGLHAGINFYITDGLYVGAEYYYGLNDMTRDNVDVSIRELGNDDALIQRADFDRFNNIKINVGFKL